MKVVIKKGQMVVSKEGFKTETVENKMAEFLVEHDHICASCCSNDCKGKRTLESPLIEKGVSTLGRTFVFECKGYKKRQSLEETLFMKNTSSNSETNSYQPTIYPIIDDDVKKMVMKMR